MLRSIACILVSPFNVFFGYFAPAVAADWQYSIFVLDVDFDVGAAAFAVPRVLTRISHIQRPLTESRRVKIHLSPIAKKQVTSARDHVESKNVLYRLGFGFSAILIEARCRLPP